MSSFMSNKFLRYRGLLNREQRVLDKDFFCIACGYNLRGLVYGRLCPECGSTMPLDERSTDVLLRGDLAQKQRTRLALFLVASCLLLAAFARAMVFVGLIAIPWGAWEIAYVGLGSVLSVAWAGAVFVLTTPDLDAHLPKLRWLRTSTRWSQLLWIPAYGCWLVAATIASGTAAEPRWYATSFMMRGIAGIGALLFAAFLMRLADQAELEGAARRIWRALWLIVLPTLILAAIPPFIPWIALFLVAVPLILWCIALAMIGWSAWQMFLHVHWDLRMGFDRSARSKRMTETRSEMDRDVQANVRPAMPSKPADLPLTRSD